MEANTSLYYGGQYQPLFADPKTVGTVGWVRQFVPPTMIYDFDATCSHLNIVIVQGRVCYHHSDKTQVDNKMEFPETLRQVFTLISQDADKKLQVFIADIPVHVFYLITQT